MRTSIRGIGAFSCLLLATLSSCGGNGLSSSGCATGFHNEGSGGVSLTQCVLDTVHVGTWTGSWNSGSPFSHSGALTLTLVQPGTGTLDSGFITIDGSSQIALESADLAAAPGDPSNTPGVSFKFTYQSVVYVVKGTAAFTSDGHLQSVSVAINAQTPGSTSASFTFNLQRQP